MFITCPNCDTHNVEVEDVGRYTRAHESNGGRMGWDLEARCASDQCEWLFEINVRNVLVDGQNQVEVSLVNY